jgi:hypothetical protein
MVWKSTHWGLGVTAVAWTVTVMVLDSNGYGVEEHSLGSWCNCCSLDIACSAGLSRFIYSVTTVSQQCDNSVTTVAQQCDNSVTTVSQQCDNSVTTVAQQCDNSVTTVAQQCNNSATTVQQQCNGITFSSSRTATPIFSMAPKNT